MYIEELMNEIVRLPAFSEDFDFNEFIHQWAEDRPEEAAGNDLVELRTYMETLESQRNHFLSVINTAQHFSYNQRDPIVPILPIDKKTRIREVPGLLSKIKANLPYKVMTFSYKRIDARGDIPCVVLLEEIAEGLISVCLWIKNGGLIGEWGHNEAEMILSTRGDFSCWDGLKKYFNKEEFQKVLYEYAQEAEGFMIPILFTDIDAMSENTSKNYERDLVMFEMDLITFIIPYIYLLNIKDIPIKELKPANSDKKTKVKKSDIRIPPITYKTIDTNFLKNLQSAKRKSDHHRRDKK